MTLLPAEALWYLAFAALLTGFIKGGMPALGPFVATLVALNFPAREALGITVILFLIGDTVAVWLYWRLANWQELRKMLVPVILGIVAGGFVLASLDNRTLGLTIGLIILALVALEPLRPRLSAWALANQNVARAGTGALAGFATTISNSAGPILNIYFLLLKLDKHAFIGTATMFFFFANVSKIPVFLFQGIFDLRYFPSLAIVAPLVYLGAFAGRRFLEWIPQLWFNRAVLFFTAAAAFWLIAANI
ncbi:MAG TPA: sulfite exporter TauE/SafE family protein [Pseudomonadales bacterium]